MASTIKLKNGSGAPLAGDLVQGEPALDLTNKRLYTENASGTVIEVGTNPGEDVTFADNRKAVFGAGSDLQIYHDGSNSYVRESGAGLLIIAGSDKVQIYDPTISTLSAQFDTNGSVTLYENGSEKLATTATGIDVTGTVTADGLVTVNGVDIDMDNDASGQLKLDGNGYISAIALNAEGMNVYTNSAVRDVILGTNETQRLRVGGNGDISFYEDTGTTAKFFWDASAESLGVGTTNPQSVLHINDPVPTITLQEGAGSTTLSGDGAHLTYTVPTGKEHRFKVDTSQAMTIDSSGRVGIGLTSLASTLHVKAPATAGGVIATFDDSGSGATGRLQIETDGGSGSDAIRIAAVNRRLELGKAVVSGDAAMTIVPSTNNVGIGTSSPSVKLDIEGTTSGNLLKLYNNLNASNSETGILFKDRNVVAGGTDAARVYSARDGANNGFDLVFETANAGTLSEAFRLDHLGNVGIGTSSPLAQLAVSNGGAEGVELGYSGPLTSTYIQSINRSSGVGVDLSYYLTNNAAHRFFTGGTERARIDSSGNLLVGTTAAGASNNNGFTAEPYNGGMVINVGHNGSAANGDGYVFFRRNGTALGSITQVSSTGVSYNTTSDQRLKENITDAPAGNIDDIKVRSFDWKADGSHQDYGMVAQELETVAPYAVSKGETEDDMWAVDYSKLVPMLIKEIQDLKAEVAAIKGAN